MQEFKDIPEQDIATIESPTLVIVGDQDVITVEHAIRMSRVIHRGRLAVIPGTHGSYLGETGSGAPESSNIPQAVALIIGDFLGQN